MNNFNVKKLKDILVSYNKSVRKKTYKGVSKLKRAQVVTIINNDFIQTAKAAKQGKNRTQFKHKDR